MTLARQTEMCESCVPGEPAHDSPGIHSRVVPRGRDKKNRRQGPEEIPVRLLYNKRNAVTLMCSPGELRELAVGWLFAEGFLRGGDELAGVRVYNSLRMVTVKASPDRWDVISKRCSTVSSGCGGGSSHLPDKDIIQRISDVPEPDCKLLRAMLASASEYKRVGGIHAAAFADSSRILLQSEDIGRHNAVDKVIGKGLLANISFGTGQLMTTGRISSDIVMKSARAGIPVVISLSVATTLAVELADHFGILLVGRGLRSEPILYSDG